MPVMGAGVGLVGDQDVLLVVAGLEDVRLVGVRVSTQNVGQACTCCHTKDVTVTRMRGRFEC